MTLCTQIEMCVAFCHEAQFLGESKLHKCRQIGAITHSLPSPNEGSTPSPGMLSKGHFSLSSEPPLSFQHWLTGPPPLPVSGSSPWPVSVSAHHSQILLLYLFFLNWLLPQRHHSLPERELLPLSYCSPVLRTVLLSVASTQYIFVEQMPRALCP